MTGFTGVFQEPDYVARRRGLRAHKFVAEAMLHGKKVSLGHFPTAILAAVHRARALRGAHRMSQVSSFARSDLVNAGPSSSLLEFIWNGFKYDEGALHNGFGFIISR